VEHLNGIIAIMNLLALTYDGPGYCILAGRSAWGRKRLENEVVVVRMMLKVVVHWVFESIVVDTYFDGEGLYKEHLSKTMQAWNIVFRH
jgi:hypothetical protein